MPKKDIARLFSPDIQALFGCSCNSARQLKHFAFCLFIVTPMSFAASFAQASQDLDENHAMEQVDHRSRRTATYVCTLLVQQIP